MSMRREDMPHGAVMMAALKEIDILRIRIKRLELSIREHYEKTVGQSACWENDEDLWQILEDGIERKYPHSHTPSMEEMMIECVKYCASRQQYKEKN